jgi:hypothetical protein
VSEPTCEECGFPVRVCSHIGLVALRYMRMRSVTDFVEFTRIRAMLEARTATRPTGEQQ